MRRKTYAIIDGKKLSMNIKQIINNYSDYKFYIGVVKNNAYHHGIHCVFDMIKSGINYLAVSSLEEAIQLRNLKINIPILCLEPIPLENIYEIEEYQITITVDSLDYLKKICNTKITKEIKIHIAIDSGMCRLGFTNEQELNKAYQIIKNHEKLILEGIYSHFSTSGIMDPYWDKQVAKFLEITDSISLKEIPLVHFGRSQTLINHPKLSFCNGIRLGICMYGFGHGKKENKNIKTFLRTLKRKYYQKKYNCSETILENFLNLNTVMSLYTEVMSIRKVNKGDVIGYNIFKIREEGYILTLPIGYADGVTTLFKIVNINGKNYPIVSDCMDMIMVYSPIYFPPGTKVEIFGDKISISSVCQRLGINSYHLFNQISHRVLRVYVNDDKTNEIMYEGVGNEKF